jgi:glycosyltransferase involved in cell wall biosynthesis/GT2 family glycosyltransferase
MIVSLPRVSIVVNTYNRGAWLDDALRGLAGLDYPEFEVIVVNGPSTDDSAAVIARWVPMIKALDCEEANLSMSRNVGIAAASGAIIAFIDDDAVPHPQWLRRLVTAYADPAVGAVGGFTVDNTGTRWQMRKVVCDRYGAAHHVTDYFDERALNRPGSPYFPSLLGTNSSFRAEALRAIGGFDHTFAYLLDETDVCLRLVDAGWHVRFEPQAMVWHQFAPSHIRSDERVARTVYPSAVSKGYFIARHGAANDLERAGVALAAYRDEVLAVQDHFERGRVIDAAHRHSLDQDLLQGLREGQRRARDCGARAGGDLAQFARAAPVPFVPFAGRAGRRIALISQGWPPDNDSGIARWTQLVAQGLSARGHAVHVLTLAAADADETVVFKQGLWIHRLHPEPASARTGALVERYGLPWRQAAWADRVWQEAHFLKSFGLDLVSFPIWDLEGLPLLDDPDFVTVVSLHTTFAMARPFKPEWQERPLLGALHVAPMIAAETALLQRAPYLLANSHAIVAAIGECHGVDVSARATVVPHGTPDPLIARAGAAAARAQAQREHAPLRVLFAGRFEPRKGFDIAVQVARAVIDLPNVEMTLVGGTVDQAARDQIDQLDAGAILAHPRIAFGGVLTREALDHAFVAADVVLMPSRFESFGLVAIEAMAAGRPVLALAGGGLGEVARDAYGARTFADAPDVAERIVAELVWLNTDREELEMRSDQARAAWAALFSAEAMAQAIEQFYEAVLAQAGAAR